MPRSRFRIEPVGPDRIVCGQCGYTSNGEVGMRLHKKASHEIVYRDRATDRIPECHICREAFDNRRELRAHAAVTGHYV